MAEHAQFLLPNVLSKVRSVSPGKCSPYGNRKRDMSGSAGSAEARTPI